MGSEQRVKQGDLELYRAIVGEVEVSKKYDHKGCPKCGVGPASNQPPKFEKKFCYGLEPGLGRVLVGFADCRLVGPHLHGTCAVCGFSWFERCMDDDLMRDGRGGLRHDESVADDGTTVRERPKVLTMVPS